MFVVVCDDLGEGLENVDDMVGVVDINRVGVVAMWLLLLFLSLLLILSLLVFKVFWSCRSVLQTVRSRCLGKRDRVIRKVRKSGLHVFLSLAVKCLDHIL